MNRTSITLTSLLAAAFVGMVFLAGCGNEQEDLGRSDTILSVQSLVGENADFILSDQQISVGGSCNDNATVTLAADLKSIDAGTDIFNDVLVTDYRVEYFRVDGTPSVPGVTVPETIQGQFQLQVPIGGTGLISFVIVRHETKRTPPVDTGQRFVTSTKCTFWGRDQMGTGNQVSAVGFIEITFSNFFDEDTSCP